MVRGPVRRVRATLLVLLWIWTACVALVLDLFSSVSQFDGIRPRSALYRSCRQVAHELVGEPLHDEQSATTGARPTATGTGRETLQAELPAALEGHVVEGYTDGLRGEGEYRSGRKHGRWVVTDASGQVRQESAYQNGVAVRLWRAWYASGALQWQVAFSDGLPADGEWTYWHENGELWMRRPYRGGRKDGCESRWDARGTLVAQIDYARGTKVNRDSAVGR